MPTPEDRNAQFERELKHALVRVDAPETLAKFLAKAVEAEAASQARGKRLLWFKPAGGGNVLPMPRPKAWFGLAAAAAIVVGCVATEGVHLHREKERAIANQQFAEATAITNRALERTREKLERAGINLED